MEKLRDYLLKTRNIQIYTQVLSFMKNPSQFDMEQIVGDAPSNIKEELKDILQLLMKEYAESQKDYREKYVYGQVIIWEAILRAFERLTNCKKSIETFSLTKDLDNYHKSTIELKKLLSIYADMQDALSELEDILGVDRFLDRISEETFDACKSIVIETKQIIDEKAASYKSVFQMRWSSTNVFDVIAHCLVKRNDDNQVCDQFISDCRQTIVFLIDGFGFCQYLWNRNIGSKQDNYTFNENIFKWLSDNSLIKELILGSSYITDTGAGLAQIYLGKGSEITGVFASKLKNRSSGENFFETKRIPTNRFDENFNCSNSITDVVSVFEKNATVYYCSRLREPLSGFSETLFQSAELREVLPSERVFSMLLDDIVDDNTEGLKVVYFTGIDNSGHTMGAYSNYERLEHKKIDGLIRNFIIELAYNAPQLFDGKRNIIITADHGMYESSRIMVSRHEINSYLRQEGIRDVVFVENNRALLIYNNGHHSNTEIMSSLNHYFEEKALLVEISDDSDELFHERVGKSKFDTIKPDIVVRFVGEGLFYSNSSLNEHLLHFGGHGGCSVDEVFIPLLEVPLTKHLLQNINDRFISRK